MTRTMGTTGFAGVLFGAFCSAACAQGAGGEVAPPVTAETRHAAETCTEPGVVKTYVLRNTTMPNDGNEVLTSLRNTLPPAVHMFLVSSQNTMVVCGGPEVQAIAERLVKELDKPRNRYKLTYTFTEMDAGKRAGTQHFSMLVTAGQRMTVKEGSRVPLATGTYTPGGTSAMQTQFQYVDVGMSFDVTLNETATGALVKTKVEQSAIVPTGSQMQPVIRQVSFEGSPTVVLGKPSIVTSLDVPDSTRHVDVEVVMEAVP